MPKIEEFNPGNLALRPSEVGVEATAGAARRIGMFFNQTAAAKEQTGHLVGSGIAAAGEAAVAIEDHREISTGAAKGVEMFANLVDSKDQAIKAIDPNDPAYGQKIKAAVQQWQEQTVEPALDQFRQGFNTQKSQDWAERFIDQTRTHMSRESTADVANAAALGVKNSIRTTVNQASNTVLQNPSSLDAMLDLVEHSIGGVADSSPVKGVAGAQLKTGLVEQAKEKLVKDAALGAILKSSDPEATAADFVKRYPKYINGDEALQLGRAAKAQNKSNALQDKQAEDYAHTQQVRQGTADLSKVFTDNVTYGDDGRPIIKPDLFKQTMDVASRNPTVADHARALLNWGEAQQNKKVAAVSDPATKQTLLDRFTSNNPPTEVDILKAEANGKLSNQDGQVLRNLSKATEGKPLSDPIYKATMDAVKGQVGDATPPGKARYATFFQNFIPAYLALPPEKRPAALNMGDPNSLISQTLGVAGKPGALAQTPLQQILEKKGFGLIDPGVAAQIIVSGETIGGVRPTGIRTAGQQVGIPPAGEREVGKTYETPNGPRIWRGGGWEKP